MATRDATYAAGTARNLQIDADVDSRAKSTKRHMGGDHVGGLDEVISEIS